MAIAERFGKSATLRDLNPSQMVEMLSLPAGEEEKVFKGNNFAGND